MIMYLYLWLRTIEYGKEIIIDSGTLSNIDKYSNLIQNLKFEMESQ